MSREAPEGLNRLHVKLGLRAADRVENSYGCSGKQARFLR